MYARQITGPTTSTIRPKSSGWRGDPGVTDDLGPASEVDVDAGDDGALSDGIAEIGDRLGWDSLTEYGREHWDGSESPKD